MKWRSINFLWIIIFVLAIVLCGNFSYAAQETTVQKILANRDSYDGQEVSVSGTVSKLKLKTSKGGNDYTTFSLLSESGGSLTIFVWGQSVGKIGTLPILFGIIIVLRKARGNPLLSVNIPHEGL
jgi:hypothetical protein